MKILIADDSVIVRNQIMNHLQGIGHDTIEVENGKQACEAVEKETFDLIIMDINMPIMSGLEAIKKILPEHEIPIVVISALSEDSSELVDAILAGASNYLHKPYSLEELVDIVNFFQR
jgi:two-component system, chemotaxis family, protein-glutamate methylesterase/glutaminase